jgi:golgi phosphoprotein 3
MKKPDRLLLHEEVMLLALRDEEGTIEAGSMYNYAIGGAILAELLLDGRIEIDRSRSKKGVVNVVSDEPIGEPLIDELLGKIATAKRRASVQTWVTRFASVTDLKHRAGAGLRLRGILRMKEEKFLLLFTRRVYPEVDPAPERELSEKLREAISSDTAEVDPRTAVLISLARSAGLLKTVLDKKELKSRKARIERIVSDQVAGKATKDAIEAAQAAMMIVMVNL